MDMEERVMAQLSTKHGRPEDIAPRTNCRDCGLTTCLMFSVCRDPGPEKRWTSAPISIPRSWPQYWVAAEKNAPPLKKDSEKALQRMRKGIFRA